MSPKGAFSNTSVERNIAEASLGHFFSLGRFVGRNEQGHVICSLQVKIQHPDWTKEETEEKEREKMTTRLDGEEIDSFGASHR